MIERGAVFVVQLLIRGYRTLISPMLPASCRFFPTCSQYAMDATANHGLLRGLWLAAGRLARCAPYSRGGFDPVPPKG